jgi:hypothetical protein
MRHASQKRTVPPSLGRSPRQIVHDLGESARGSSVKGSGPLFLPLAMRDLQRSHGSPHVHEHQAQR